MDKERTHRTRSMDISTTTTATTTALTTSLSRRLRRNGSLRGGIGAQSPALFPKKNRGSSVFTDNPEPSSPKVTCIGQVRVKTKKQGKKIKFRTCGSRRVRRVVGPPPQQPPQTVVDGGGNRGQKWVHLPFSICDSLNCLLPCKGCFSGEERESCGDERESGGGGGGGGGGGCGVVYRWFVSLEEGKRREIEMVVGGGDGENESGIRVLERERVRVLERESSLERERGRVLERESSRRRSIFDDMEFDDLFNNVSNNVGGGDGGSGDGDCVPPKNALLLMRCRSDPKRMASLSRKYMEAPSGGVVDEVVDEGDGVELAGKDEEIAEVEEVVTVESVEVGVKDEESVEIDTIEEVVRVESVELGEVDEEIGVVCEGLNDVEKKGEGLVCFREELERKIDGGEGEDDEEIEVKDGVEASIECEEMKEIGGGIEEEHSVENVEKDEMVLLNVEETRLIEGENEVNECLIEEIPVEESSDVANGCSIEVVTVEEGGDVANGCSIEVVTVEESGDVANGCSIEVVTVEEGGDIANGDSIEETVDEGVNDEHLVEMLEEIVIEVLEKGKREESLELSNNSSSKPCVLSEESKELVSKREKIEVQKEVIKERGKKSTEKENNKPTLPDCLLLMMWEPKLSMEVSKETWVSSHDFARWLPERHRSKKANKTDVQDDQSSFSNKKTKLAAVAAQPPLPPAAYVGQPGIKPGRSSISFSTSGGPVANFIEQKWVKTGVGVGYEPSVLPRCKSAPIKSAVKFAQPELACSMWGREHGCKLEPHRSATCGMGAAGVV